MARARSHLPCSQKWASTRAPICLTLFSLACTTTDVLGTRPSDEPNAPNLGGGPNFVESSPDNHFTDVPLTEINAQLNDAFLQLFFGDPDTEAVFRDQGDGTGYIEDIFHGDVRTDSMAYGMLASVQLDQREVFDKLWNWTKLHMLSTDGPTAGLLMWRCELSGANCDGFGVTDGMSIVATSLFMATSRWGSSGAHYYADDALALLEAMTTVEARNGDASSGVHNMFDLEAALPRPTSSGTVDTIHPDFLMPAFYEIWARRDVKRSDFWRRVATNARILLDGAPHPETGLLPSSLHLDGTVHATENGYGFTTARSYLFLAIDHEWNGPYNWISTQHERVLDFFLAEGLGEYVSEYSREGQPVTSFNTSAHIALVATAAGTSTNPDHEVFLEPLLELPVPTGDYRYYDGMLYLLSLLTLSGQMVSD